MAILKKSLYGLVLENEKEYTYYIKSVENLFTDEMISYIGLALAPYQLREIERDIYKPFATEFKDYPNYPLYIVKVVTGLKVPEYANSELALYTSVNQHLIKVDTKRDNPAKDEPIEIEVDTDNSNYKPLTNTTGNFDGSVDYEVDGMQQEVGTKRIDAFMKELRDEKKNRAIKTFEDFVTTNRVVETLTGKAVRKGFYVVESTNGNISIEGPFAEQPCNMPFHTSLKATAGKVISEKIHRSGRRIFELDAMDILHQAQDNDDDIENENKPEREKFSIKVKNTDTGAVYSVVVSAYNSRVARRKAVDLVSKEQGLSTSILYPMKPKSETSVIKDIDGLDF